MRNTGRGRDPGERESTADFYGEAAVCLRQILSIQVVVLDIPQVVLNIVLLTLLECDF